MRVVIEVNGRAARTDARHAGAVDPLVSARAIRWVSEDCSVVGRRTRVSVGAVRGGAYEFPARLAPRVAEALRGPGREVVVAGPGGRPLAPPIGLLAVGRGAPADTVAEVLRGLAGCRTAFACRNRRETRAWRDRLAALGLPQPVVGPDRLGWEPRVVVTTLTGLTHCTRQDFDAAVVPDARPLLASAGLTEARPGRPDWDLLLRHDVAAVGFAPGIGRLTPAERLAAECLFGTVVAPARGRGRG